MVETCKKVSVIIKHTNMEGKKGPLPSARLDLENLDITDG
jgi:hypothetical protein